MPQLTLARVDAHRPQELEQLDLASVVFGVLGIFYNPMLLFIAFFIWVAAQAEATLVHVRSSLEGVTADVADSLVVNVEDWKVELSLIEEWFDFVGDKLPTGVKNEFEALKQRLAEAD